MLVKTSDPTIPVLPESAKTTITPLATEGDPFGWFGIARFHTHGACPRIPVPSADVAKAIPTSADKKAGQAILEAFAAAETVYWANNAEPLLRTHERSQNIVERHRLMSRVAVMDPEKCEAATGAMHVTRREAASLAATLTKRLGDKLLADFVATTEALEDDLEAKGIPVFTEAYQSPSYVRSYTLHSDPRFNQAQLVWLLAVHHADRLSDPEFVDGGTAGEFDTVKWFLGQREECPLSAS